MRGNTVGRIGHGLDLQHFSRADANILLTKFGCHPEHLHIQYAPAPFRLQALLPMSPCFLRNTARHDHSSRLRASPGVY